MGLEIKIWARKKSYILVLLWIFSLVVVCFLSLRIEKMRMMNMLDYQVKSFQAELWNLHLDSYSRIEFLLKNGCIPEAKEKVGIEILREKRWLAILHKEDKNVPLFLRGKFDFLNDSSIIALQNGWVEPDCKKNN